MKKLWVIKTLWIASVLIIQGCGGGSDSNFAAVVEDVADTPAVTDTAEVTSIAEQSEPLRYMADLSVPNGFSYDTSQTYSLTADLSLFANQKGYLSVYSQFEAESDGSYQPQYSSRLVSTPLDSGTASISFTLASATTEFLVEVWSYDGNDPLQKIFSGEDGQISWQE